MQLLTSSNFLQINVNALNIAFVVPVTVTIRSGHDPSDMFIFAPDCNIKNISAIVNPTQKHKYQNCSTI